MSELRKLELKDIEEIKAFFTGVFTKEPWNDDWSDATQLHEYMLDLMDVRNALTLGFFEGEELVGLAMGRIMHWYKATEYYIQELCIKTEVQGKGLGTTFLAEIEKYLVDNDIHAIFLQTEYDVPAYEFYKKNGFVELKGHVSFAKDLV